METVTVILGSNSSALILRIRVLILPRPLIFGRVGEGSYCFTVHVVIWLLAKGCVIQKPFLNRALETELRTHMS